MSEELKPCPFCGKTETVRFVYNYDKDTGKVYTQVICDVNRGGCGGSSGFTNSKEETIKRWNTRAEIQEALS